MHFRKVRICFINLLALSIVFLLTSTDLGAEMNNFSDLAKKAGPAVVNISTVKTVSASKRLRKFFSPFQERRSPFDDFFERFFPQMPKKRKKHSLGSGFIISEDGYIVTNAHVISEADKIKVDLKGENNDIYTAKVVGTDKQTDLALLKIDVDRKLPSLDFGNSKQMEVGEWVVAIGNPFGLDHTVTSGIISAKGRVIGAGPYDNFIQTDASINPGNSGGPLLNMQGRVVGINTAIVAQGENIGFAIPSDMAKDVISQLKKYKKVKRGWLGVVIQDVDKDTARALNLPEAKGALVASVKPGDPADKVGIESGDVIFSVEENSIENTNELTRVIGSFPPGRKVNLKLWRNGEVKEFTVKLGSRNMQLAEKGGEAPSERTLGMQLRKLTPREARALNMDTARGLVVLDIKQGSPAAKANLRRGDVILRANKQPVNSREKLKKIIENVQDKTVIMLLINRDGQNLFTTISWD